MRISTLSRISLPFLFSAVIMVASCQDDNTIEFNRYYSSGRLIYETKCQNCHGSHGEGLQNLIPPLSDTMYLKSNRNVLACAIKYGLKGKIFISNRSFEGEMPANDLAPVEIAELLTYINNSFGNKLGINNLQQTNDDLGKCR